LQQQQQQQVQPARTGLTDNPAGEAARGDDLFWIKTSMVQKQLRALQRQKNCVNMQ